MLKVYFHAWKYFPSVTLHYSLINEVSRQAVFISAERIARPWRIA